MNDIELELLKLEELGLITNTNNGSKYLEALNNNVVFESIVEYAISGSIAYFVFSKRKDEDLRVVLIKRRDSHLTNPIYNIQSIYNIQFFPFEKLLNNPKVDYRVKKFCLFNQDVLRWSYGT